MQIQSMFFKQRASEKLGDELLQGNMRKAKGKFVDGRAKAVAEFGVWEEARTHAAKIRDRALAGHIPYDFAMDYQDPGRMFCSEVAAAPYAELGIGLWTSLTTMSSRGTTAWLSALGVEHFETLGPSDLEYDPQVVVVADRKRSIGLATGTPFTLNSRSPSSMPSTIGPVAHNAVVHV